MDTLEETYREVDNKDQVVVYIQRPRADRLRAGWRPEQRIADYRRLFAFYIDLVQRVDFALEKDPKAHDRMMRDGQIFSAIRIRQLANASRGLSVSPREHTPEAIKYADLVKDFLFKIERLPEVLLNILDAIPKGISVQEIVWKLDDDLLWRPEKLYPIHPSRLAFDTGNNLVLKSPVDIFYGERLPPNCFVVHTFDPEPGDFDRPEEEARIVFGHGLLDRLYPWWLWKSILLRLQLRVCERSASGAIIGKYPWKNREAQAQLMEALDKFDSFSRLVWPSGAGFDIEILKADQGAPSTFDNIIRYIDEQIGKMILGSTLLLDVGTTGSFAMSEVHERTTFGKVVAFDAFSVLSTIRDQLIKYIFIMNQWDQRYLPNIQFKSGPRWSLTEVINAMDRLISIGYPVSYEIISEETGVRQAGAGESIIQLRPFSGDVTITSGPEGPLAEATITAPAQIPEVIHDRENNGKAKTVSMFSSRLPIDHTVSVLEKEVPRTTISERIRECINKSILAKLSMKELGDRFVEPYSISFDPRISQYVVRCFDLQENVMKNYPLNDILSVSGLTTVTFKKRFQT